MRVMLLLSTMPPADCSMDQPEGVGKGVNLRRSPVMIGIERHGCRSLARFQPDP